MYLDFLMHDLDHKISPKHKFQAVSICIKELQKQGRKQRREVLPGDVNDSLLQIMLKAIIERDVGTIINCLERGCNLNDIITVGSNIAALYKPWSQFIVGKTRVFF